MVGILLADGAFILLAGSGLMLVALAYLWNRINLAGLHVEMLVPMRVEVGKPFDLRISLQNEKKWLPSWGINCHIPMSFELHLKLDPIKVASSSTFSQLVAMHIQRRMVVEEFQFYQQSSFPFALFDRCQQVKVTHRLLVHPRLIVPVEMFGQGNNQGDYAEIGVRLGHESGEPRGLRPWQNGDFARDVHWPSSVRALARGRELRVRESDPPGFHPSKCRVIFHSYAVGGELLRGDRFELAISLFAGAVKHLVSSGVKVEMCADLFGWRVSSCSSPSELLSFLDRLAMAKRPQGTELHELEQALSALPPAAAAVVISDVPLPSWQHVCEKKSNVLAIDIRQFNLPEVAFLSTGKGAA